jgi:hypothetical protein
MKKLLLFTIHFVLLGPLLGQQGTFTISRNAAGTIIITNATDLEKEYTELVLLFDGIPGTSKIDFVNADGNSSLYGLGNAKLLNTIGTDAGNNKFSINIVQNQGNYVIKDKSSPSLMTGFFIEVDGKITTKPFQFKPIASTPPLPNPSTTVVLSTKGKFYKPGYLLYDALYIKENLNKEDSVIREILKFYEIKSSTDLAYNQYLKNVMPNVFINTHSGDKIGNMTSSIFSNVGNLDVTNFADGLAKFIVERTKEELNIAFFDKFKEVLSDPKYVDLKTVFPETYGVLMVIDNQIYNYEDYLQALRNAFDRDLSNLPNNLPSIIDNHSSYFDANPGLKVILQSSFYIAQQVQLKEHPGQMIANYPVDEFMGTQTGINQNIAPSFKTLQLVSRSFKSKTDSLIHYWASDSLIKKLFNDDDAVKIYIGLLVQQSRKDSIAFEGKELWKIIDGSYTVARGYEEYKNFFRTVSSKIRDIEKEIDALEEIDKDSLRIEKYHTIAGKALDLMDHLVAVEKMPYFPKDLDIAKKAGIYIYSARTASDIVIDVNRKQYASAIMKTVMLYDTIFHKDGLDTFIVQTFASKVPKIISLREQMADVIKKSKILIEQIAGNTPTADQKKMLQFILTKKDSISKEIAKIINDFRDSKSFKKWEDSIRNELSMTIKSLLKYGTFMSAIIDAKTSDEVEAAIESAALPVGSARIKRESTFNIALNAYCGPYMGYERVYDLDSKWMSASKSTVNSYGLTAPVGISISYGGNCKKAKNHSSYSLFLSVIDIGAIASFRFRDSTTEILPTIQLKNILSPGIFFSYGIPTLPISVNAGWQMGPLLRKVDAQINENTYSDRYGRVSLSICIDIPIVNFYTFTSSKKPKYRL